MNEFSVRLREARGELLQAPFADAIGVSRASLSAYENGTRIPDIDTLRRIHEVTGVSLYYLLGLSDSKDDALATVQKDTGLSEKALETFATDPLCTKVINHIVDCGSMKVFSKLAAIIHDDVRMRSQFDCQTWPEYFTSLREALFNEQLKSFQALTLTIFTDMKSDKKLWGVEESHLPYCRAYETFKLVQDVRNTLDLLPSNDPDVVKTRKLYEDTFGILNNEEEASNAQETPEP